MKNIYFLISIFSLISCGELSIIRGDASPGVRTIAAASATLETATLDVSTGNLQLAANGTADVGCTLAGANGGTTTDALAGTTSNTFSSANTYGSFHFTVPPGETWTTTTLLPRMRKNMDTTLSLEVRTVSGGNPTSTVLASGSHNTATGTYNGDATGNVQSVALTPTVLASGDYAIVMYQNPYVIPGLNYIHWTNSSTSSGCTNFGVSQISSTAGASWTPDGASRRRLISLRIRTHEIAGQASWIVAGYKNAIWDLSTFDFSENPNSTTGTITYDVGAGDNFASPSYSLSTKTESEIQASSDLTGNYFFVRANLSVNAPGYDNAVLADGSIEAK